MRPLACYLLQQFCFRFEATGFKRGRIYLGVKSAREAAIEDTYQSGGRYLIEQLRQLIKRQEGLIGLSTGGVVRHERVRRAAVTREGNHNYVIVSADLCQPGQFVTYTLLRSRVIRQEHGVAGEVIREEGVKSRGVSCS